MDEKTICCGYASQGDTHNRLYAGRKLMGRMKPLLDSFDTALSAVQKGPFVVYWLSSKGRLRGGGARSKRERKKHEARMSAKIEHAQ
jgi:hypothetical protein